jgi:hypothetical protein
MRWWRGYSLTGSSADVGAAGAKALVSTRIGVMHAKESTFYTKPQVINHQLAR